MSLLVILLVCFLLFGGLGGGYWGHNRYGSTYPYAGPGIGFGTILLILLVFWLFAGHGFYR